MKQLDERTVRGLNKNELWRLVGHLQTRVSYLERNRSSKVISQLIRWGGIVALGWMVVKFAEVVAGKRTELIALIDANADAGAEITLGFQDPVVATILCIAVVFGISGILYGIWQRSLRMEVIARLSPYQRQWEVGVDPNRSSSALAHTGQTRPEDQ